jgi:PHD/YefM family antitoxin component YafN of YafNO toxin-antitoxin module
MPANFSIAAMGERAAFGGRGARQAAAGEVSELDTVYLAYQFDNIELSALSMIEDFSMIDLREVRSVTEFQRNIKDYVGRLKESRTPLVLTVNGRAELVVQDAASYQEMLDRLERAETLAAIRRGMKDAEAGLAIPLKEAAAKLRAKHGL